MENKSELLRWLLGAEATRWGCDPADYDPDAAHAAVARLTGTLFGPGGWFGVESTGLERVPEGPVMVVSNHSGGTIIPDVWGFVWLWYTSFGYSRPIHPGAHEIIFSHAGVAEWLARRGVVRAHPTLAREVLTVARHALMVMPGGERDTWRPYSRRYEVEFAGRTGYAREALRAGVPIVPVANAGAHETLIVLSDGRWIAERVGLHRIARASIWPVHLSIPWGLAVGPWPHVPIPKTLRYAVGEALYPERELAPGEEPAESDVRALDARVRASMQQLLHQLRDAR